jgi:hypothetical protein
MESAKAIAHHPAVVALRRRVEKWRATHPRRSPIPDDLWKEAARLAGIHGISPISTALRLGYYGLRDRVEARKGSSAAANRPAFIEIETPPHLIPSGWVIEAQSPEGRKMTIRAPGAGVDLVGLLDAFWSRGR